MTEATYSWRKGAHIKGGVSAQTAGAELERIRDKHDGITPDVLVDESRPADAPLHPAFTWDDAAAAENWRKDEARHIVKSVRVEYADSSEPEPAYVNVRQAAGEDGEKANFSYYESTRAVVQDINLYESAYRQAQSHVDAALRSLSDLERIAREQVSDQAVARAEATRQALSQLEAAKQTLELAA